MDKNTYFPLQLTFQNTLADVIECNRILREQRVKAYLILGFGGVVILLGLFQIFLKEDQKGNMVLLSGLIFLVLGLLTTRLAGFGAWILKTRNRFFSFKLDKGGVIQEEMDGQFHFEWKLFSRWNQTKNLILVVTASNLFTPPDVVIIPKRCCCDEELKILQALLEDALGKSSGW